MECPPPQSLILRLANLCRSVQVSNYQYLIDTLFLTWTIVCHSEERERYRLPKSSVSSDEESLELTLGLAIWEVVLSRVIGIPHCVRNDRWSTINFFVNNLQSLILDYAQYRPPIPNNQYLISNTQLQITNYHVHPRPQPPRIRHCRP